MPDNRSKPLCESALRVRAHRARLKQRLLADAGNRALVVLLELAEDREAGAMARTAAARAILGASVQFALREPEPPKAPMLEMLQKVIDAMPAMPASNSVPTTDALPPPPPNGTQTPSPLGQTEG